MKIYETDCDMSESVILSTAMTRKVRLDRWYAVLFVYTFSVVYVMH